MPTILEATGIPAPETVNGITQKPIEGVSMAYTWDKANADAPSKRDTQYFEMFGNRAIYHDGWIAATTPADRSVGDDRPTVPDVINGYKWELYDIKSDFTESNDLAGAEPGQAQGRCRTSSMPKRRSTTCCRSTTRR